MSRLIRPLAWAMAAAALAASVVAAVVIAVAAGRGIPDAPSAWEGLPLVVGVGAPACVGLVLAAAPARHPGRLDPAGRGAVGRARDGRRRAWGTWRWRTTRAPPPAVGCCCSRRSGWCCSCGRSRSPTCSLTGACRRRAGGSPRRSRSRRAPGRCCCSRCSRRWRVPAGDVRNPLDGRRRPRLPRARVLGLLVRAAALAVRRRAGAARALPRGEPGAPPAGPVARLRRGAAAAVARRDLAGEPALRRVRVRRTCSC